MTLPDSSPHTATSQVPTMVCLTCGRKPTEASAPMTADVPWPLRQQYITALEHLKLAACREQDATQVGGELPDLLGITLFEVVDARRAIATHKEVG